MGNASDAVRKLTSRDARLSSFKYYDLLVHVFVVILLISNLVAQKMCVLGTLHLLGREITLRVSGAQLLFPLTYIFGDIFTEVYGYGASRRAIWLGFFASGILTLMGLFVVWAPADPSWPNQKAFEAVFYTVPRAIAGSLLAFWAGEFTNSYVMARMKLWTNGKRLWTRTVGSTVTGQLVDTVIVILVIFAGTTSWAKMGSLILGGYVGKVAYEVIATPLTYWIINTLKRKEGVDVYDRNTNFNPFARAKHNPPGTQPEAERLARKVAAP